MLITHAKSEKTTRRHTHTLVCDHKTRKHGHGANGISYDDGFLRRMLLRGLRKARRWGGEKEEWVRAENFA